MIHIIGGGIAGFALAEALDARGRAWALYERSHKPGPEASGKNAGIIRTYEADPVFAELATESLRYYQDNEPSFQKTGILLRPWEVDYGPMNFERRSFTHGRFSGYFLPENGTVLPGKTLARIAETSHKHGKIFFSCEARINPDASNAKLILPDREILLAKDEQVVIAAGEGSAIFSDALTAGLGLIPHRRTLYEYHNASAYAGPVEWDEESGCYFRALGDEIVATAGEQIPVPVNLARQQQDVKSDEDIRKLAEQTPLLAVQNLKGYRTCFRTMPLDNRPFCGADTVFPGVYWLTGLGGRGMSIGPALAQAMAALICGEQPKSDLAPFSPARVKSA